MIGNNNNISKRKIGQQFHFCCDLCVVESNRYFWNFTADLYLKWVTKRSMIEKGAKRKGDSEGTSLAALLKVRMVMDKISMIEEVKLKSKITAACQSQATQADVTLNSSVAKIEISTETKKVTDRIMPSSPTADFYVFMNIDILLNIIEMIGICPEGHSKVKCHHDDSATKKKGLAHVFVVTCCSCPWYHDLYTSKEIVSAKRGSNKYDVNVRAFIAFREIGRGYSSIQTFCQYMNMSSPMTKKIMII